MGLVKIFTCACCVLELPEGRSFGTEELLRGAASLLRSLGSMAPCAVPSKPAKSPSIPTLCSLEGGENS